MVLLFLQKRLFIKPLEFWKPCHFLAPHLIKFKKRLHNALGGIHLWRLTWNYQNQWRNCLISKNFSPPLDSSMVTHGLHLFWNQSIQEIRGTTMSPSLHHAICPSLPLFGAHVFKRPFPLPLLSLSLFPSRLKKIRKKTFLSGASFLRSLSLWSSDHLIALINLPIKKPPTILFIYLIYLISRSWLTPSISLWFTLPTVISLSLFESLSASPLIIPQISNSQKESLMNSKPLGW